jgi:hypothetical protein
MEFDDLEAFITWWIGIRPFNTPTDTPTNYNGVLSGVVLYRQGPYQVQLFNVQPNSEIEPHIHPNVDSYEVFVGGDINFMCDDVWFEQNELGSRIRVKPSSWHGGKFGARGGCFLSVQKWLNGVPPTSVGDDWHDKENNTTGTASKNN